MAKKKKSKKEEVEETVAETVAEVVEQEMVSSEEFESVMVALAEKENDILRARADFANYKKRVERNRVQERQDMKGDIIKRFLPVMDDMLRALQNAPEDPWVEGIQLIYRKLEGVLDAENITRIEAEGAEFDPNFHEAIGQVKSDEHESGQVAEVLQEGYMLGERIIRPAVVRVAE
ncbi:MAG: nucleotide exchange factor GrpE [Anaerolineae bacterium]|jgi:molecular chaperone GrpE|nr:nucleotide exchange factor GrpE [Anaerolineae bacterium]MBT3711731.1 nucleotide exchange factor GrpE [Anaerolineae bacterium]MBT4309121.1 nucleotide exchange factor GrpE [Anaerolineae bacterium]MBT4460138.1 nucleotide exchange factor GrpE [Anaerolineae bacterium]MBT4843165.1 nucleotide exchange factor GrpE [Anaerolineae bacterium]